MSKCVQGRRARVQVGEPVPSIGEGVMSVRRVQTGVNVSAARLSLCLAARARTWRAEVPNDADGHQSFINRLRRRGEEIVVALEATGTTGSA